ncbi:hypothetical protein HZS_7178 [Henneguya salminicola]|nr:hypothetical protein HZS_7178 [Henneguya salminicola]
MDERRKIFFNEKLYQVNKPTEACIYYRCSKFDSGCGSRLFKKRNDMTLKGKATTNAESFPNSYICEKCSRLELYPHQIYESLLLTLRQQFTDMVYDIPSKKHTYARI